MVPTDPDPLRTKHLAKQKDERDKKYWEEQDQVVFRAFLDSLQNYYLAIRQYAEIPSDKLPERKLPMLHKDISNLTNYSPAQITLLHHALAIKKLHNLALKIFEKAEKDPGKFARSNITGILSILPKTEILSNFISRNSQHYGKYQAELQNNNPDVFRFQAILALQQQEAIAKLFFQRLRLIFPEALSESAIEQYTKEKISSGLGALHISRGEARPDTAWFSRLIQTCYDLRRNTSLKIIDQCTQGWLGTKTSQYLSKQVEEINQRDLLRDVVELVDLEPKVTMIVKPELFSKSISELKLTKFNQLQNICDQISIELTKSNPNLKSIELQLNTFKHLTPLKKPVSTDDLVPRIQGLELNQENLQPILTRINNLISQPDLNLIQLKIELYKAQELLKYSTLIAIQERDILFRQVQSKIVLARKYRDNSKVIDDIIRVNIRLTEIRQSDAMLTDDFTATTETEPVDMYQTNSKLLFELLRERIEIKLSNPPTTTTENWDNFLLDPKLSMDAKSSLTSYFKAITPMAFMQKFPALLEQQLDAVQELNKLESDMRTLLSKKDLFPESDPEPNPGKKIAGKQQINEHYLKVVDKRNNLLAFIQYFHLKTIATELSTIEPKTENITNLISSLNSMCDTLKTKQQLQQPLTEYVTPLTINSKVLHTLHKQIAGLSPQPKNLMEMLKKIQLINNSMYSHKIHGAIIKKTDEPINRGIKRTAQPLQHTSNPDDTSTQSPRTSQTTRTAVMPSHQQAVTTEDTRHIGQGLRALASGYDREHSSAPGESSRKPLPPPPPPIPKPVTPSYHHATSSTSNGNNDSEFDLIGGPTTDSSDIETSSHISENQSKHQEEQGLGEWLSSWFR